MATAISAATATLVASGGRLVQITSSWDIIVNVVKEAALISHPHELKTLLKLLNTVLIKGIQPVTPVHLQLPLSHLLGLFYLHGIQLHLVAVPASRVIVATGPRLLPLILLVLLIGLLCLRGASRLFLICPIL